MQEKLVLEYNRFKKEANLPDALQERLSPPLLIKVSKAWEESNKRVLAVVSLMEIKNVFNYRL